MIKPVLIQTQKISKDSRKAREEAENYYQLPRMKLVPPPELNERAKTHFEQIANEAFWLDELSADLLAAYCVAYDRFLSVLADFNGQDDTLPVTKEGKHGRISELRVNPNRSALLEYANTMRALSASLGIGNIDRLRLALKKEKEKVNKFEEFIS